jgi:putative endonuclease
MPYYICLLTNWNDKVMYVGVTKDLLHRLFEHKNKLVPDGTKDFSLRSK